NATPIGRTGVPLSSHRLRRLRGLAESAMTGPSSPRREPQETGGRRLKASRASHGRKPPPMRQLETARRAGVDADGADRYLRRRVGGGARRCGGAAAAAKMGGTARELISSHWGRDFLFVQGVARE